MKKGLFIMAVLVISGIILGCSKKESNLPVAAAKVEQKQIAPEQINDGELALAFLAGIQNKDKKRVYEISNLTSELVEESRAKLTNTVKYKLTKKERAETEHALRMSGSIDFFLKKLTSILPKSAQLQVMKSIKIDNTTNDHHIKITYSKREEAVSDKTGKSAKEIVVKLKQIKHVVNGLTLQEFVFDNKDFEKMADKNFEVVSYY